VRDRWARWLLRDRHGGDPALRERLLEQLAPIRDRVLDGARIADGDTVLDLGCGDGLIGFGALERGAHVIFSDVSEALVERCREIATELDVLDRCRFVVASADDLGDVEADAVTARSVLIYLDRAGKRRALREAARVLGAGGRLSVWEPINRFTFPEPPDRLLGFDVAPVGEIAAKVKAAMEAGAADSPLLDFDERDLFAWAEEAGFAEVRLTLEAEQQPELRLRIDWETALKTSGNPLSPTLGETIAAVLSADEAAALEAHLRPLVDAGAGTTRLASAHLHAAHPHSQARASASIT
jgi:arsenite methyltransferase